jgi:hypothetical protein
MGELRTQFAAAVQSLAVWKSTSASSAPDNSSLSHFAAMAPSWLGRGTTTTTTSSRRRVDGVNAP